MPQISNSKEDVCVRGERERESRAVLSGEHSSSMASPTPWRWRWRTKSDHASNSLASFSPLNSSLVFPFSIIHRKRTRIVTFSFNSSPPPRYTPKNSSSRLKKTVKPVEFVDGSRNEVSLTRTESPQKTDLSLKPLFRRRAMLRRILFASGKVRSIILLNVITFIYASDIPVVKEVEAIMDPEAFTAVRFVTSAIPFLPFVLQARGDVQTRNAGIELGFWVSLGYLMQTLGLLTSDAGRASFISMFTVIVVPLLDGMLGAIVPARTWFGALMSILGVAMLETSGSSPSVGDLLNFLSAVFFGVHMLRTEHISRNTTKQKFLPLLGYEVCMVAVLSTLYCFVEAWFGGIQEFNPSSWTWPMLWDWMVAFPWMPALYTGMFSTGLCLWIEMAAMRDVSASETAIIYGLEPVWGAGFAWFLLGERWGVSGWIGAALVLGGSLVVQISGFSSPSSPREGESFEKGSHLLTLDKQNDLSTSPIVISSRKDAADLLKK